MPPSLHEPFIRRCYALAAQAAQRGDHPFGALLVHEGRIIAEAENTVVTTSDPTGHAETNLVRLAARQLPRAVLLASVLYTSTEPCVMCSGAIYWAGIGGVVYGCAETDLARHAGDDFLTPCRTVFARGQRPVAVVGPVLAEEGERLHAGYWKHLGGDVAEAR